MRQRIIIANLIDWSRSFVDETGTFYCGTTDLEKYNTAAIISLTDLVINTTDLHPLTAPEHKVNGGLYPVHNAVHPERLPGSFTYMTTMKGLPLPLGQKTASPTLTGILREAVKDLKAGIVAPRGVYFQGGLEEPFCTPQDVEETFGERIITPDEFIGGDYRYIIAPKQYFDASRLDSDFELPQGHRSGIPDMNFNIYSLIKKKFPEDKYELVIVNTGVVEGICRLHTSIGLKEMLPKDRIINITDATTPLHGIGLGYSTPQESREACEKVCKDVGIEHITTEQFLEEFSGGARG